MGHWNACRSATMRPMCRRLIEAGNSLTMDKSEAAMRPLEATWAPRGSPAAVASAAEIRLASLPTPPIVPLGLMVSLRQLVKIFIDVSTTVSLARQAWPVVQRRRISSPWMRP